MRLLSPYLFTACLFAFCTQAYAGAWTQERGKALVIANGVYYTADKLWDNQGNKQAQPTYTKYELNPYLEYGLLDGVTVGANLSLQRAQQETAPVQTNWGIGDSELFARLRLWQYNGFVVSAEPMVKLPSPEPGGDTPQIGGRRPDAGLGLSAGYGFSAFGQNHFADIDAGYRHRFGTPQDQIKLAATLGVGINSRLMILPQAFATYRTDTPSVTTFTQSSSDDYNMVRLQLSTIYKINDAVSVQAGGFADVSGKNVGIGRGLLFFRLETLLMQAPLLGSLLLERGFISQAQLERALKLQQRSASRLGDILVAEGMVGYLALYQTIAAHHGLPFVNLIEQPPAANLLAKVSAQECLAYRAIPWRMADDNLQIATSELSQETLAWIKQRFGDADIVITSPFDIRRAVEKHFTKKLDQDSRLSLWQNHPHLSARATLRGWQQPALYGLALFTGIFIAAFPWHAALAFIVLCHIIYAVTLLFKYVIFTQSLHAPHAALDQTAQLKALDEQSLPPYTVLVPMYREAGSLPGLLDAMRRMDYPASKLDIKLVLEADDQETYQAAQALKPCYHFDIIRVPPSEPRTKPKACNYALRFARGELITIFDADDRPERLQLKKAVLAFRTLPADVACVQARLNYYNANDNWLTRFFSLEYTQLFHFMLYGLQRIGIPIPLGGTSNHINLARLKELGEWDPYNVTEDADLGTRLAAHGWRTAMLDSYTLEEAPNRVVPWIRQRSRWIKGYMQTWLVHMRHPLTFYRTIGFKGFIGFQCFVGFSCFTFLTAPIVLAISLLWYSQWEQSWHQFALPDWVVWLTLGNLAVNMLTHWYYALYCAILYRKNTLSMIGSALLYPAYLILHCAASYKALKQLIVNPHFWEKTVHGLARKIDYFILEQ